MKKNGLCVNPGKTEIIQWENGLYYCYAIKTKVITQKDALADIVSKYAKPFLKKGDILFLSEKMVACTQGRAIQLSSIIPGTFARILSKFVTKSKAGIGLAMPETMQCAIDECGLIRILLASAVGMFGKLCKKKGWFYRVAGYRAACIDGPCSYTIPPYNEYVVLAPAKPDRVAVSISKMLDGVAVLIVDVNDIGANILGSSKAIDTDRIIHLLRQNPLGQSVESTPMWILRASFRADPPVRIPDARST